MRVNNAELMHYIPRRDSYNLASKALLAEDLAADKVFFERSSSKSPGKLSQKQSEAFYMVGIAFSEKQGIVGISVLVSGYR